MPGIIQSRMASAGPCSARNAAIASWPSCVITALKPHFSIKLLISVRETGSSSAITMGIWEKRATAGRASSSVALGWSGCSKSEICQGGEKGISYVFDIRCIPPKAKPQTCQSIEAGKRAPNLPSLPHAGCRTAGWYFGCGFYVGPGGGWRQESDTIYHHSNSWRRLRQGARLSLNDLVTNGVAN